MKCEHCGAEIMHGLVGLIMHHSSSNAYPTPCENRQQRGHRCDTPAVPSALTNN